MSTFLKNIHPLLKRSKRYPANDPNHSFLDAIDATLTEAEQETIQSKIHSSLRTATGEFLELWGDWHGIRRGLGETDEKLRERIVGAVNVPRGTIRSIVGGIESFMGDTALAVVAQETWKDIFWLNKSKLNSDAHMLGNIYRYGVVLVTLNKPYPAYILELISLYKPVGVTVIVNYSENYSTVDFYSGLAMQGTIEPNKTYFII